MAHLNSAAKLFSTQPAVPPIPVLEPGKNFKQGTPQSTVPSKTIRTVFYTVMHSLTTFRSTMDCIYGGGPIIL
jgi:hypothetical protein